MPYRSLIEALYTLNSPPVVSFNLVFRTLLFKIRPRGLASAAGAFGGRVVLSFWGRGFGLILVLVLQCPTFKLFGIS